MQTHLPYGGNVKKELQRKMYAGNIHVDAGMHSWLLSVLTNHEQPTPPEIDTAVSPNSFALRRGRRHSAPAVVAASSSVAALRPIPFQPPVDPKPPLPDPYPVEPSPARALQPLGTKTLEYDFDVAVLDAESQGADMATA